MSLGHGAKIVRDGLVLHLDAANNKSYSGGTTWSDLSGNGNNGTLSSVSLENNYMLFDNANDYVIVNHAPSLNFLGTFTVSTWVLVNSFLTTSIYNIVSKKPSFNNTQKGWSCQYDYRTTGVLQYRNNNGTSLNDHTPTASINNTSILNQVVYWANAVWVINNSSISFYINAEPKSTVAINFTDTDTAFPIYIGKTLGSVGDPAVFSNKSVIKVYNRALSAAEIRQNFEATKGRYL